MGKGGGALSKPKCLHIDDCDCSLTAGDMVELFHDYGELKRSPISGSLAVSLLVGKWARWAYRLASTLQKMVQVITAHLEDDGKPAVACKECKGFNLVAPVNQNVQKEQNPYTTYSHIYMQAICLDCGSKFRVRLNKRWEEYDVEVRQ